MRIRYSLLAFSLLGAFSSGVSADSRAFITNQLDNSVSVIDTKSQQVEIFLHKKKNK